MNLKCNKASVRINNCSNRNYLKLYITFVLSSILISIKKNEYFLKLQNLKKYFLYDILAWYNIFNKLQNFSGLLLE